jgi:hypothetical protein
VNLELNICYQFVRNYEHQILAAVAPADFEQAAAKMQVPNIQMFILFQLNELS